MTKNPYNQFKAEEKIKYYLFEVEELYNSMRLKAETDNSPYKPLIAYPDMQNGLGNWRIEELFKYPSGRSSVSYYDYGRTYGSVEALEKQRDEFITKLDEYVKSLADVRVKNLKIISHNQKVIQHVKAFMTAIGFPASYSWRDPNSRARNPKVQSKNAGYLEDINRNIKTTDFSYDSIVKNIESRKKAITAYVEQERKRIAEEAKIKADAEKQNKKELFVSTMKVKYKLPFDTHERDIFEKILSSNKYLRLAHYLQANRLDWSDGYDLAETGLDGFEVVTKEDHDICIDIQECLNSAENGIDGRVFRDTTWNYDRIFRLVHDQELLEDYNTYKELCSNGY
ncbi:hypothetical protein [Caulobacter phage Cr30]|uniref:hypothetical protein n=1 Tax=Caulobacter phage Cr30 TaxID=1357714 RepID=UPI0004A9B708|nr:hypothetical protein OZ74_gp110 [Caulobacter phage Cr30]AGS80995.1 hypothetical protein [Caulobacter phage Cr30]